MKTTALLLSLVFLCSCGNHEPEAMKTANEKAAEIANGATNTPAAAQTSTYKKYEIKSGVVTFETSTEVGGYSLNSKQVLYFDDYGLKECEEKYTTDAAGGKETLTDRAFVKDGYRYTCSVENKGGTKTKAIGYGIAVQFNMDEAAKQKDLKYSGIPDETICGKACKGFSMTSPSSVMYMHGWSGITLKSVLNNKTVKSSTVATKIEENVAIPPDKFEVPAGVTITDR